MVTNCISHDVAAVVNVWNTLPSSVNFLSLSSFKCSVNCIDFSVLKNVMVNSIVHCVLILSCITGNCWCLYFHGPCCPARAALCIVLYSIFWFTSK